jgi:hypothetical protein
VFNKIVVVVISSLNRKHILTVLYMDVGIRYRYANKIMVSDELPDGQMIDQWEPVGPNSILTPFEVFPYTLLFFC